MLQAHFHIPDPSLYTTVRPGETKLGEAVRTACTTDWENSIAGSSARFVWLGLAETV